MKMNNKYIIKSERENNNHKNMNTEDKSVRLYSKLLSYNKT